MRADCWPLRRAFFALCVGALIVPNVVAQPASAVPSVDTTIVSGPGAASSSTSATFTFTASKSGATFTCKLDSGSFAACPTPKSYTGLAVGTHTFSVFATWNGTTDPTPASYTWTIDTTAPSVPTGLAATTPSSTSVKLTWNASADNIAVTGYDVFRDSALLTTVGAVTTYTDSTVLGGSTHGYQVRARDGAGNVSALSAAVSATTPAPPPDTFIDSAPPTATTSTSATFTFHASATPATFTCKLDAGTAASCTSPKAYTGLTQSQHTFTVYATVAGIADPTPASWTWTVDATPPSTPTGLAATTPSSTSVRLTWTASTDNVGVTGYDVLRGGALLATVGGVTTYTDTTVAASSTYSYQLQARDAAGNVSALSAAVSVTTPTPPDTLLDSAPPAGTTSTSATFTFHASATPATFTCKLDAGTAAACTSPKAYTGLTQSVHTFTVFATVAGIADPTPASWTWTADATPPTAPTGLAATTPSATSVALSWTASTDNTGVTGYDVFRDSALLTTIAPATTYTDSTVLAGSTHTYAVRARDVAGNVSALSATVSATTPVPQVPFDVRLTRAPYLTDLVGLNAIVNFATDQSSSVASVRYGPVDGAGVCSLTSTQSATHISVPVNAIFEYQWKANLTLPAAGKYCYRAYLAAVDLLAANPSPSFTSQVPLGATAPFSFAVFGDWGQVDANGNNADQANLMKQIAASGSRFAITTGDNGYPAGSQGNYGDLQQTGADTGAVFGRSFWGGVGQSLALFPVIGNHGLARSDANHPHLANWPQDVAVATSGGRYQKDTYCCPNGSMSAVYPSPWYAFDAGNARFYMLDAAWADLNPGTGTPYSTEYLAHWATSSPEYLWLKADLAAHPSGLKFAFFHYPMYSDQPSETSDISLQGNASLEGLLASNGVNIAFSGHAHIYQRNASAGGKNRQSLVSYVTGGGGADLQSLGLCSATDKYAIGWSDSSGVGSNCGTAPVPTSRTQIFHFLKVTISGSTVTVTPTDELGRTFDVQTYTFTPKPDTFIDSGPPVGTTSTSATFTFHGSSASANFTCKLDTGAAGTCTSPKSYTGLAQGSHTFTVYSTVGGVVDPIPATSTWTVDTVPPSVPGTFAASPTSPFSVTLMWNAATDNTGVTGYDVYRDGVLLTTVAPSTSYIDTAVVGPATHTYAVRARDVAGNVSPFTPTITVAIPAPPPPIFADGFESADLSAWTTSSGLVVETAAVHGGTKAAEGNTANGNTYAKKTLPSTYTDAFARVWYNLIGLSDQVNLLRMRDASGASLGYLYITTSGALGFHNDATNISIVSGTIPAPGWHALELHLKTTGTSGVVDVWLDNVRVVDLSSAPVDTGTSPVAAFQIGETQTGRTYDVVFDDAGFGTSRLGPAGDTAAPTVPTGVIASPPSPFSVHLDWTASTDNVGVIAYDVFRDGAYLDSVGGAVTTYTDTTVVASTGYSYAVRARDLAGNQSALSAPALVTTPAAAPPIFADGFESGDTSAWTTTAGLVVQGSLVRTGSFAAEGNTTNGGVFAKRTLGATFADGYARVAYDLLSQTSQVNLLRMRDAAGNSIGYVFVSTGGHLGFHNDATGINTVSSAYAAGVGWHVVELHLGVNGASSTVEVWLDGAQVSDLSFPAVDLGTSPIGIFQIGETQTGQTYDVVFDDAAFGTSRLGPAVDTNPPSIPANLVATATSPFAVDLSWNASTDDVGVTGYDVFRDGVQLVSLGATTSYTDTTALASSTYDYAVRARDGVNVSALSAAASVTTPSAAVPLFADGFESGDISAWTSSGGLTVESTDVRSGGYAAEGNTTNGGAFAKKTLPATYADGYARLAFEVKSQVSQVNLLRMRDAAGVSIGYVYLTPTGQLAFHNDTTGTNTLSTTSPGAGWHALELHLGVNGVASTVEVWLDGVAVPSLSSSAANLGTSPVGVLQIGETQTGQTYDVVFDDAAFGTSRLGPVGDTAAPSVPGGVTAIATSPFSVLVNWTASTDDVAVTGYDVFRDGVPFASLGAVTGYTDTTVLASSTHDYAVRARDGVNNVSALSTPVSATTPSAALPLFADGFESGDTSVWTSSGGLTVESTDVRSGGFAAEGNTTNGGVFAKKTLPATYADGYARLGFELKSQVSQVNLLRMRDAAGVSIGYVFVSTGGKLGFHDDTTGTNTLSATAPGAGWHALELHLGVNGAASTVEVWLDGAQVSDLSFPAVDLGTSPIGILQIGETQTGQTYDVVFDDAAFGTSRLGPVGDVAPPSVPGGVTATATSAFSVQVDWTGSTDDVGVTGYDVFRDGALFATVGPVTTHTDTTVLGSSTHAYAVRARDGANNVSALSEPVSATTPSAALPLFADGFEAGNFGAWTSSGGLTLEGTDVRSGGFAAEGNTTNGGVFAKKTLGSTYADGYARLAFEVKSQVSQVNLLRVRDAAGVSIGYVYVTPAGQLAFHNDTTALNTISTVVPGAGWHAVELHLGINGAASTVEVWLDGVAVSSLSSSTANLGTSPIGILQIGETQTGQTYDVVFDDAAFGTSRLGPVGDVAPPSVPGGVTAAATSAFSVQVDWTASTDDVGVTGYDVFRDGALFATLGAVTTYTDTTVLGSSTHDYAVRARDGVNNLSALSVPVSATTPSAALPLFADGFEAGNLAAWTSSGGLTVESTDVRSGGFAAEGNTTNGGVFAKKTLGSTYTDGYARLGFEVKSHVSQVNLLRVRDAAGVSIGYVYVTSAGQLAFHNDTTALNTISTVVPGAGWHALELHLGVNGAASTVEVWLDGVAVPSLSSAAANLGTSPIGILQIGETQAAQTYDVVYDDAAFGTSRLGPVGDVAAPSVPGGVTAAATSAFSVQVDWTASTDDVGVTGYDLFRDGVPFASLGATTTYTDTTVLSASTHDYAVRARDGVNNLSALSVPASATTPSAALPLFADGFEAGNFGAWTSSGGLVVEGTDVRSGGFAAEGNTTIGNTFAKKTLGSTYADGYARLAFEVKSQVSQVNLLRVRDAAGVSIGYVYVATAGQLAFHNDTTALNTISTVVPGAGWHALELHLGVNGAASTVEVWLDGVAVPSLSSSAANLGTSPIGILQIGETQTGQTYDVVFDDAAFGTSRLGPAGDVAAPSVPGSVTATASSPFAVDVSWDASTDDVGVTGYDLFRDGAPFATLGAVTTYRDTTVLSASTHDYAVRARDGVNNLSALTTPVSVTTPSAALPLFADGFEAGNLAAWTSSGGLVVEGTDVRSGGFAAEGNTANGGMFAKKTLPSTYADGYARLAFEVKSQVSQVNLLRVRDAAGVSIGYVYVTPAGQLAFHNDTTAANTVSTTSPGAGWHALELHLGVNGAASTVEVWLDGVAVPSLSSSAANLGTSPVGVLQIGETQTGQTYDVVYDDAAFGTSRLGPAGDVAAPSVPGGVTASATSAFSVQVDWTASTDDVGVTGYDLFRDGAPFATLGAVTTYTDTTVLSASTHDYAVRARDGVNNLSALSVPVSATTPSAALPLFADGFEAGNFAAWTSSGGLVVEGTDVRSGGFAAEGNTTIGNTFAKKTLPSTYADGYARLAFEVKSQVSQVNLLRVRDAAGVSIGYVYVTTAGQLAFHNDTTALNTISTVVPGAGWHALELHLGVNGAASTVDVWLDGVAVPSLSSSTANLGTSPVGVLQIGETQTGLTYDVVFDDAAFGASRLGPVGDVAAPSVPGGVTATATSPFSVQVDWTASTDDVGVTGYDLFRDSVPFASLGAVTTYTDTTVLSASTHAYAVRARDGVNNLSALSTPVSVTTPSAAPPLFADGFESGNTSAWTSSGGLVVEGADVRSGGFAAEGNTTIGNTFGKKTLPATYADGYARLAFEVKSQVSQINLLRMRDAAGVSIGYVFVSTAGKLAFHNDTTALDTISTVAPGPGWHTLDLHLGVNGAASTVDVWLDDVAVPALSSSTANLGTSPIGILQIGETQTGRTYDVVFDEAQFGTSRLGPFDTAAPSAPASLTATATSPFSVDLIWAASTDNVGVTGYAVFRDGALLASLGLVTTFTDYTAAGSTAYTYTVKARDGVGNVSAASPGGTVTTPAAPVPLFADGFESGNLTAWTSSAGLTAQSVTVRSGAFAAEGNTTTGNTFAKKTLAATYADGYGRVAFDVKSQVSQINLLRMRDAAGVSIGFVYLTTAGQLAFHNDTTALNTISTVVPGAGWHAVELHVAVNGAASTVGVWLDGAPVAALSGSTTLGTAPIGIFQIGETQTARTYDVVFDDAAFGDQRLGR